MGENYSFEQGIHTWRNVSFNYEYQKVNGKNQFTKVSGINLTIQAYKFLSLEIKPAHLQIL